MSRFERSFPGSDCAEAGLHGASRIISHELPLVQSSYPALSEKNMQVKNAMSGELIAMGLTPEAVARILNIEQE